MLYKSVCKLIFPGFKKKKKKFSFFDLKQPFKPLGEAETKAGVERSPLRSL